MGTFLFFLFVILVGGGWLIGKLVGSALFPDKSQPKSNYVDRSTTIIHHHHYHDNRSVHVNGEEFKSLKK
jgi:hypothetical protein